MQVRKAAEEYLRAKRSIRAKTRKEYAHRLAHFSFWCEKEGIQLEDVKPSIIRRYLETVSDKSISTQRSYTRVIKGFLRWCSKEEEFEEIVKERTVKRIEMPKVEQVLVETFTPAEIKALFAACSKANEPELRARDYAILALLLDTGIRASELAFDSYRPQELTGLRMEHTFTNPSDPHIRVYGKGKKQREVGLGRKARLALTRYIKDYRGNSPSPFVFLSRRGDPLTVRSLEAVLERLAKWSGVKDVHPHKFRHTYACRYLLDGGDIYKLSRLMGHTKLEVTQLYLRAIQDKQARQGPSVLDNLEGL